MVATDESSLRTVSLKVRSATGLRNRHFLGPKTSVSVKIDGQVYATSLSKRTTTPVWDEEFIILIQNRGWTAEFNLQSINGSLIGKSNLTDNEFTSLFLSSNESAERFIELSTGNGKPNSVKLHIAVRPMLVSSPRLQFLRAIQERSQFDISQISPPQVLFNGNSNSNAAEVDIAMTILGVMKSISQLKPVIDRLASVHPYANLAWQILTVIYNTTEAQKQRDQRVVALVTSMQNAIRWLIALDPLTKIELLENSFTELFDLCCRTGVFVQWYCSNSFGGRVIRDIMTNVEEKIQSLENSFGNTKEGFSIALGIQTVVTTSNIDRTIKADKANVLIQTNLPCESAATWDPTLTCLDGTREDILQEIFSFIEDGRSLKNVFWLAGLAGSGKSTIAHTVGSRLATKGHLGGCFFFSRHESKRNEANSVIPTLAHGIAAVSESIKVALVNVINRNPNVANAPLRRQFLDLLVEPLKSYSGENPIIIILDALDECATPAMREDLLTILAHDSAQLPPHVRIFVTARPEQDIEKAFSFTSKCTKYSIDLDSPTNIKDITIYTTHQLTKVASSKAIKGEWPSEIRRNALVLRSAGLFIWAATACEFIRRSFSPEKALDRLLSEELPTSATSAIDSLYATALQAVEGWQDEDFIPAYQVVVGTIIALRSPLSSDVIEELLGSELNGASVNRVVSSLGCVLAGSEGLPIRVLHPSFSDYLTSQIRCKNKDTLIDVSQNHYRLSRSTLSLLNNSLKYDICNLVHPGRSISDRALVPQSIPDYLQYACHFWSEHVVQAPCDDDLLDDVHQFLLSHGLHWMEAMSLIGLAGYIRGSLHSIRVWAHESKAPDLERLGYDLERFSQTFSHVIIDLPLHIYTSALPFTPRGTSIHQDRFVKDKVNTLKILRGYDERWPRCSQILEGHEGWVRCVAFSSKGVLASGADDASVRIWDLLGGTSYIELKGHEQAITSVAFSSNGNKIITGSGDKFAFIWDSASGERLAILEGHRLPVTSVAFTHDRTQAVTASMDKSIRIWDATLGSQMGSPIITEQAGISSISISPTTNLVSSGSVDGTVCISSLAKRKKITGPLVHAASVHVTSVVFSHNEKVVASAGRDGKVSIWTVCTGERMRVIDVSSRPITSVRFTQNDSIIAVGCNDYTLSLWNVDIGEVVPGSPIEGHLNTVSSVALSADQSIIASGSYDSKIRLWEYLECIKPPLSLQVQGHKTEITVIRFDAGHTLLASGDSSGSICIWNCQDGEMLQCIPDAHIGAVSTLAFSKQGDKLVSGGNDTMVTCWSLADGGVLWTSKDTTDLGHERRVSASVFNNEGSKVATGGEDRYIFLWDADSGELAVDEPLERDGGYWIQHLTFSADDTRLLSLDVHEQKTQWDVDNGVLIEEEEFTSDFIETYTSTRKLILDETGWVVDEMTGNRAFWIPADHRGDAWATADKTFAVGNRHGVVTIIGISEVF